jgi:hypothetical protein
MAHAGRYIRLPTMASISLLCLGFSPRWQLNFCPAGAPAEHNRAQRTAWTFAMTPTFGASYAVQWCPPLQAEQPILKMMPNIKCIDSSTAHICSTLCLGGPMKARAVQPGLCVRCQLLQRLTLLQILTAEPQWSAAVAGQRPVFPVQVRPPPAASSTAAGRTKGAALVIVFHTV